MNVQTIAQLARESAITLAAASTGKKNALLRAMADKLASRKKEILHANEADLADARSKGLPVNLVNRLRFGEAKIDSRIRCLEKIAALPDPVGQMYGVQRRPNGLRVARARVPLGVILMIYEARPHVTVNAGAFCLKSGNAAILRGGSEAKRCNAVLGNLWREALTESGLPQEAIQVIAGSHEEIGDLLQQNQYIDLVIPRGIPVVKHFAGICHVYLDRDADVDEGIAIALDSKCLMPEVCNAMETLLVCEQLSQELPRIVDALRKHGVTIKGCERTQSLLPDVEPATEEDWRTEYLDTVLSLRVVSDVDEAIEHINRYGSHHTDAIVTDSERRAGRFVQRVDSAVVLVNASTMFCDGESLGMGAEIGISTDKIHARGPMGLEELTSYKFVIRGDGHVMGDGA
jgi:glutamate-5-semialdehyde dehydrogenase